VPLHASSLNPIAIVFSIIQRKLLQPNDFDSAAQLARALNEFERYYNRIAEPSTGTSPAQTWPSCSRASRDTSPESDSPRDRGTSTPDRRERSWRVTMRTRARASWAPSCFSDLKPGRGFYEPKPSVAAARREARSVLHECRRRLRPPGGTITRDPGDVNSPEFSAATGVKLSKDPSG
jgi:hypothetical protein